MNIERFFRLLSFLSFLTYSNLVLAEERIAFINDNLGHAMNQASSQGKLIFLDFYADYCSPCKLMEEYTFSHPSVVSRMNAAYVPVKVNIENFDGFDLKNQFKVTMLPTLIVLDSKGRLVGRYEESMSASRLVEVLAKHNIPSNRKVIAPVSTNPNNNLVVSSSTPTRVYAPAPTYASKPATPNTSSNNSARPAKAEYTYAVNNAKPTSYNTSNTTTTTGYKPLAPSVSPLIEPRKMKKTGFTIQIGNFSNEDNAKLLGSLVQKKLGTSQKVFMLKSESNRGTAAYKVFVGNFSSRQQAVDYRESYGFEGFVQDYASYK
jgi:cell division septation protein DedD